jgi:hypothetical protein
MTAKRPKVSPFSGVQPDLQFETPEMVIEWIKDGNTKIEDWDEAAKALKMSVDELRKQVES